MLKSFLQGFDIQFNLSTPATLGVEETGHCREV